MLPKTVVLRVIGLATQAAKAFFNTWSQRELFFEAASQIHVFWRASTIKLNIPGFVQRLAPCIAVLAYFRFNSLPPKQPLVPDTVVLLNSFGVV